MEGSGRQIAEGFEEIDEDEVEVGLRQEQEEMERRHRREMESLRRKMRKREKKEMGVEGKMIGGGSNATGRD